MSVTLYKDKETCKAEVEQISIMEKFGWRKTKQETKEYHNEKISETTETTETKAETKVKIPTPKNK